MIAQLKSTQTLLIEPHLWRAMLDGIDAKFALAIDKRKKKCDGEEEDCTDCYGEKMPEEFAIGKTLVIPIHGMICKGLPEIASECGFARVEDIEEMIFEAANDQNYERVILDIDSPGGMINGVPELADAIATLNESKEVIAFTSGMMCSAAYWIAAGCNRIISTRSATIGSIGCYTSIPDMTGMWEMMGLIWRTFRSGKYKGAGVNGTALSEEQERQIQADVDTIADQFKAHVTKYRPMVPAEAMEGQSFIANESIQFALVDDIATGIKSLI